MKTFNLTYVALDGALSGVTVFTAPDPQAPVVLILPAMGAEAACLWRG